MANFFPIARLPADVGALRRRQVFSLLARHGARPLIDIASSWLAWVLLAFSVGYPWDRVRATHAHIDLVVVSFAENLVGFFVCLVHQFIGRVIDARNAERVEVFIHQNVSLAQLCVVVFNLAHHLLSSYLTIGCRPSRAP
jgi:hypothetical protein